MWFHFLTLFTLCAIFLFETGPIQHVQWMFSLALWMLMAWCFSTKASVATVLTMHPCISRCLRVNSEHKQAQSADLLKQMCRLQINSLWLSDTTWQHRSRLTLMLLMACCQMVPSHYITPINVNPYHARTELSRFDWVNIMVTDALAPCVAAVILNM